jgi:DMSO/TMAO reductase YedYZ molybdopterin-dependent catalytic subunit
VPPKTPLRPTSRRDFLELSALLTGGLLAGCGATGVLDDDESADDDDAADDDDSAPLDVPGCTPEYDAGTFVEVVPFENDGAAALEETIREGHDARRYTDLRKLDEDKLVQSNDEFYVRTEFPDLLDSTDDWVVRVRGLVDEELDLRLDDLLAEVVDFGPLLMECSGNSSNSSMGLLSAAEWSGIPLQAVLDRASPTAAATRLLASGFDERTQVSTHSTPGAAWVFDLDDLLGAGAFLATHMNGARIDADHGFPVRLFIPGWYGCAAIKWLDELRFVDDDEPATSQMQEFASRTHQDGTPALARDYIPATIDTCAMPTRVEKWVLDDEVVYRVLGIVWGGDVDEPPISVQWGDGDWQAVTLCPERPDARTWGLWWTTWRPTQTGVYALNCRVDDPTIRTRRLQDSLLRYERVVIVDEVGEAG